MNKIRKILHYKTVWSLLVLAITCFAFASIFFVFDDIFSKLNFQEIYILSKLTLQNAIFISFTLFAVTLARAMRWIILLGSENLPKTIAFLGYLWCFLCLAFLPFRLGEVQRPAFFLAHGVDLSALITATLRERVFDLTLICALLSVGLFLSPWSSKLFDLVNSQVLLLLIICAFILVCGWIFWQSYASSEKAPNMMQSFFKELRSFVYHPKVFVWSLFIWGLNCLALYTFLSTLEIEHALSASLLILALINLAVAVLPTPGGFGPFEAVMISVLSVYGLNLGSAAFAALFYHILVLAIVAACGLSAFFLLAVSTKR